MSDGARVIRDPLPGTRTLERLNYATGMLLDAADLRDEQTFHRASLALVLRHALGMGTLSGLDVTVEPVPAAPADGAAATDMRLVVTPGLALDPLGRLMAMDVRQALSLARWVRHPGTGPLPVQGADGAAVVTADVFLSLVGAGAGLTPAFAEGPFDALDAVVPQRIRERAVLTLVPRAQGDLLPENAWPADRAAQLKDVRDENPFGAEDGGAPAGRLRELPTGLDPGALFLARVTVPVTQAEDGSGLVLDLTRPVQPDNDARPFVALPGKWKGLITNAGEP